MISLLSLPAIVVYVSSEIYSFAFASINMLLQGFINAVCLSSFFGLASYFPFEYIIIMSTGQGIAGILMNVIQFLILFTLPPDNNVDNLILGTWIFFAISSFILAIVALFVYLSYKNNYFRSIMANSGEFYHEVKKEIDDISSLQPPSITTSYSHQEQSNQTNEKNKKDSKDENDTKEEIVSDGKEEKGFKYLILSLWDLNALVLLNYVITFALYPGSCLKCPFL